MRTILLILTLLICTEAGAETVTCRKNKYSNTVTCSNGVTWRKSRYGDTIYGSNGTNCRVNRYSGTVTCRSR